MKRVVQFLALSLVLSSAGCWASKKEVKAWATDMDRWIMEYRKYDYEEQKTAEDAICNLEKQVFGEFKSPFCGGTDTPAGPTPPCRFGECEG